MIPSSISIPVRVGFYGGGDYVNDIFGKKVEEATGLAMKETDPPPLIAELVRPALSFIASDWKGLVHTLQSNNPFDDSNTWGTIINTAATIAIAAASAGLGSAGFAGAALAIDTATDILSALTQDRTTDFLNGQTALQAPFVGEDTVLGEEFENSGFVGYWYSKNEEILLNDDGNVIRKGFTDPSIRERTETASVNTLETGEQSVWNALGNNIMLNYRWAVRSQVDVSKWDDSHLKTVVNNSILTPSGGLTYNVATSINGSQIFGSDGLMINTYNTVVLGGKVYAHFDGADWQIFPGFSL
jgi:hypothetical protein